MQRARHPVAAQLGCCPITRLVVRMIADADVVVASGVCPAIPCKQRLLRVGTMDLHRSVEATVGVHCVVPIEGGWVGGETTIRCRKIAVAPKFHIASGKAAVGDAWHVGEDGEVR